MTNNEFNIRTPWGRSQHSRVIAEGVVFHSTSSHGGIHLTGAALRRVKKAFPGFKSFTGTYAWLEEDCDANLAAVAFPESFTEEQVAYARRALARWHPELGLEVPA